MIRGVCTLGSFLEMYPLCTSKPRPIFRRDDAFAPVADMKTKASVVDPANQHIFFDNVETESIGTCIVLYSGG